MPTSVRGHFLWHELMTTDPAAATAFYKRVVGWRPAAWDHDPSYTLLMCGQAPMGGLMAIPAEAKEAGAPPNWMAYVGADDIDATVRRVQELGGRILRDTWEVQGAGRIAILADPQGAVFAALAPANLPVLEYPVAVGDFSWHELVTPEPDAAFAFYRGLFGWEKTGEHDMGPMGVYREFGIGGVSFGGIFRKPADMPAPPHWLVYAKVYDSKRVAAAAQRAGGIVINGPMEVPGGDWIAQIVDPQGAVFAVHSVKPAAPSKRVPEKKPVATKGAKTAATAKAAKPKAAKPKAARPKAATPKGAKPKASKPGATRKVVKTAKKTAKPRGTAKGVRKGARKAARKVARRASARRK